MLQRESCPLISEPFFVMTEILRQDHDSPWKEALENRFPEFLEMLFPAIHAEVDWSRELEFLDKELQQVVQDAERGRRHADKLVKVWASDGSETWVLIHVEVQGDVEAAFAERMYVYHYRLFDRYKMDIVSLGVLADTTAAFRPSAFRWARWGCEIAFRFPTVKLLDRGYSRSDILELFRIIDWMIRLPDDLEREFLAAVYEMEEAKNMPYVISAERFGIEKGRLEGKLEGRLEGKLEGKLEGEAAILLRLIDRKYGSQALAAHRERVEQADAQTLLEWAERVLTAETVEDVFH
jgi:hypothetical protein